MLACTGCDPFGRPSECPVDSQRDFLSIFGKLEFHQAPRIVMAQLDKLNVMLGMALFPVATEGLEVRQFRRSCENEVNLISIGMWWQWNGGYVTETVIIRWLHCQSRAVQQTYWRADNKWEYVMYSRSNLRSLHSHQLKANPIYLTHSSIFRPKGVH